MTCLVYCLPITLLFSYYYGLALQKSADDHNCIWTMALTDYVFMVRAILVINAWEGSCPRYYNYNARLYNIRGSLLFRLPSKILDAPKYFGLYKFASRLGTDTVLTAVLFHRCGERDWEKTAVQDWVVPYHFPTGEVYGHSEKAAREKKCVRAVDSVLTTVTLTVFPVTFRTGVLRVNFASTRQDCDAYRRQMGDQSEVERAGNSEGVDLDVLFENNLIICCGPRLLMRRASLKRHC